MTSQKKRQALADELKRLGARKPLPQMALDGQLLEIRCEMPYCYHEDGRRHFEDRAASSPDWRISFDHYPQLAKDHGPRNPGNARLAHVYCNRTDQGWRLRARALLNSGRSLEEIAARLNRRGIQPPQGRKTWTGTLVRRAQIS